MVVVLGVVLVVLKKDLEEELEVQKKDLEEELGVPKTRFRSVLAPLWTDLDDQYTKIILPTSRSFLSTSQAWKTARFPPKTSSSPPSPLP